MHPLGYANIFGKRPSDIHDTSFGEGHLKPNPQIAARSLLATMSAILTAENPRKKRTLISWCFMCKSEGEHVDHLLLYCKVANRLWRVAL